MNARYRRPLVIGLAALYVGALGFLSGMVVERIRFDLQRTAALTRLDGATEQMRTRLMDIERGIELRADASGRVVTSTIGSPPSP